MKVKSNLKHLLTIELVEQAVRNATKKHRNDGEVQAFHKSLEANTLKIYQNILSDDYYKDIHYRYFTKRNTNGKLRHISCPTFVTRVYQHVALLLLSSSYESKDPNTGFNCKKGYGITAKHPKKSFMRRLKNFFFDRRDLNVYLVMDERKCYDHVTIKMTRRALKMLTTDRFVIDFVINISFLKKKLPIGTPTSPFIHHLVHLSFDLFLKHKVTKDCARYADDTFLAFRTKEEAQQAKWRIQQFWWYVLGVRAKTLTIELRPFSIPLSICGYKYVRLNPTEDHHNKGIVLLIRRTCHKINQCTDPRSMASYYGLAIHADMFNYINNIAKLKSMPNLIKLVDKLQLDREWSARPKEVDELIENDIVFAIHNYEIRQDTKTKVDNWMRMYISTDGSFEKAPPGKRPVYIVTGNYTGLMEYIRMLESAGELSEDNKLLTNCALEKIGKLVVFKGSVKIDQYLEDGKYKQDQNSIESE